MILKENYKFNFWDKGLNLRNDPSNVMQEISWAIMQHWFL